MEERHHEFTVDVHDVAHDHLDGDLLRLNQICLNLLSNAAKYTTPGGKVRVEIYEEAIPKETSKTRFMIVVQDNGMGISEAFQQQMYSSFTRATNTRTNKIQGSGLGLSICKQIVELMGGEIVCKSAEGQGTSFTVGIPLTVLPNKEPAETQMLKPNTAATKGMHLLVVEDNNVNWRIARDLLEDEGITVERAENGQECLKALTQAEENHFDAILMDVEMPIMDGKEATRHIRASAVPWIHNIPIFATTANAFSEDVKSCLDAGMNDHIPKPIDIDVLLKKLAQFKVKT